MAWKWTVAGNISGRMAPNTNSSNRYTSERQVFLLLHRTHKHASVDTTMTEKQSLELKNLVYNTAQINYHDHVELHYVMLLSTLPEHDNYTCIP